MPVAAEVMEANSTLESMPELVNEVPYGAGWILRVKLADPAAVAKLLDAAAYAKLI